MFKTIRFIYELGVKHERRRVKLLISEHMHDRPTTEASSLKPNEWEIEQLQKSEAIYYGVKDVLTRITQPNYNMIETMVSPLDED
jgi:hypothetical protein